jgi:hypothetical protein
VAARGAQVVRAAAYPRERAACAKSHERRRCDGVYGKTEGPSYLPV